MGERARITQYFAPLAAKEPGSFGLKDDAAVISPPAGHKLVVTTDSVIEGIHVLPNATPQQFAQKLMRRNLSDLAAMGAKPWRHTLNLHTPKALPDAWLAAFAAALTKEQDLFHIVLIGGDSTSGAGPIHTTLTCFGLIDGKALHRTGAQIGDDIYVSGTVGDAAYALSMLEQNKPISEVLAARYHAPTPRLELGAALRMMASAAIDISDGLLADVEQLCGVNACGARLELNAIPLSSELQQLVQHHPEIWHYALAGGDDYELCFTAAPVLRDAVHQLEVDLGLRLTRIGSVIASPWVEVIGADGVPIDLAETGWEH